MGSIEVRKLDLSETNTEIENLKQHSLQNLEMNGNSISGNANEEYDSILFMSIPYSKGWKCYIDGTEAHVMRAEYGFSAVQVPGGAHKIQWKYCTPWLVIGIITAVSGFAGTIFGFCEINLHNKLLIANHTYFTHISRRKIY